MCIPKLSPGLLPPDIPPDLPRLRPSSLPRFYSNHIMISLPIFLTYYVPPYLPILNPYLDVPTETSHYPISVNEETSSDNPYVLVSLVLRIYSTIKPSIIPSPSPLSFLTSGIFPTKKSSDKPPNFPLLNPSGIPHWTHIPTDYPDKSISLILGTDPNIFPTQHPSSKPSNLKLFHTPELLAYFPCGYPGKYPIVVPCIVPLIASF